MQNGSLNFYVTVLGRTYRQLPTPNRLVNFIAVWGDGLVTSGVTDVFLSQQFIQAVDLFPHIVACVRLSNENGRNNVTCDFTNGRADTCRRENNFLLFEVWVVH